MTPPEDWRRAMHTRNLRDALVLLAIIATSLSIGLIAMGAGLGGWWGTATGSLGLAGAVLLWMEV